jgi:DNA-binding CsgD family transcriptional regulator
LTKLPYYLGCVISNVGKLAHRRRTEQNLYFTRFLDIGALMSAWNLSRVESAFADAVASGTWNKALDVVSKETSAYGAVLLPISGDSLPNVPYTASMAESADTYFKDSWYLRDERNNGLPVLIRTGVADDFDAMPVEQMKRHPYYQEFLAPHGLRWFAGVRVSSGSDMWVLSIQRTIQQGPFSAQEKDRLRRLTQSLPGCIGMAKTLGAGNGANILEAFEFSRTPAVLYDRHRRVICPNRTAEALLQGDVRISQGKIVSIDPAATTALDRTIFDLLYDRDAGGVSKPVKLTRRGQRPLLAYPGRVSSMISNPLADCQAMVVLVDPDHRKIIQPATLRHAFELTEAEARLAALLGSGAALEEACERLKIAKDTGRNHLKNIFGKMGTHRQAELVMMMLSLF